MIGLGGKLPEGLITKTRLQPADQGMPGFIQIPGFTQQILPGGCSPGQEPFYQQYH